MRERNKFQRGSGCYTCSVCKKLTRSTGRGDNEFAGLCERCYDMAGDENAVTDGDMTTEEFEAKWNVKPFTALKEQAMTATKTTKPVKTFTTVDAGGGILVDVENVNPAQKTAALRVSSRKANVEAKTDPKKKETTVKTEEKAAVAEKTERKTKTGLRIPQVRVLLVLTKAKGPLTRGKISEKCGNKTAVVVGRAVGYSDPEKRAAFRETRDGKIAGTPLLDLKYVREKELDVDGVKELVVEITAAGKKALEKYLEENDKPTRELNDHYHIEK